MLLIHAPPPGAAGLAPAAGLLAVAADLAALTLEAGMEALCGPAAGRVLGPIPVRGRLGGSIGSLALDPLD